MTTPHASFNAKNELPKQLTLLDSTSIIVGIIIGSAIYEIAPLVAHGASGWGMNAAQSISSLVGSGPISENVLQNIGLAAILGVWIAGALVALIGAMCYAELATAFPQAGGTYVYLSEGLGRPVGFAFAWSEFWIVRPGNVGAVAFVLARYGVQLLPAGWQEIPNVNVILAAAAILTLAALNALGLKAGKWTQNALTACKLAGLAAIVITAFSISSSKSVAVTSTGSGSLALAMVLVMFAYGGWADMSFVAAEVRNPARNIFRALLLGTLLVGAIYLTVNIAFVGVLGVDGLMRSEAVAAKVVSLRFGELGSKAISLLVCISCLGAINGMLLTGSRVYYALGTKHALFRWLGQFSGGVPLRSLIVQTAVTLGLVVGFGILPQGFERLVVFTGPFYWGFIGLVGPALAILRWQGRTGSSYRVPVIHLTGGVFTLSSMAMVYAALDYAISYTLENRSWEWLWAAIVVFSGIIVGAVDHMVRKRG